MNVLLHFIHTYFPAMVFSANQNLIHNDDYKNNELERMWKDPVVPLI
jgi:hypothetical protein